MHIFKPAIILVAFGFLTGGPILGQFEVFSKEDLVALTPQNPFDRCEDGRPRVPDELLERLRIATVEQAWGVLKRHGYLNQWEGGWVVIDPGTPLIGRAFTAQFMPVRPDVKDVIDRTAAARGLTTEHNIRVIDQLQKQDVVVVDLFGKIEEGTFVGGNLGTSVFARTGTGWVVDGAIRDPEEIFPIEGLTGYQRAIHPSALAGVMLTGINVPVRIGDVTVLPGDVVLGDRAGVVFIPPHLVQEVVEDAERVNLKDEFTKMKMLEGKYHPSEIYPVMNEAVKKEFEEWLRSRPD